jgi:hypothetical protein
VFEGTASWVERRLAVSSIAWLDLCAWLVDKSIIIWTITVERLSSTARASLRVATEDVQLTFANAAIVARLSICSPIVSLFAIANALKFFAVNLEGGWDGAFFHRSLGLTSSSSATPLRARLHSRRIGHKEK